jgi:phage replication-related protein YjqB (UPF0714/DUF867 family)
MRAALPSDDLRGFDDVARRYTEGDDYSIHVRPSGASGVAIIAPHGGRIEGRTSEIARLIAGDEYGLYLFEGLRTTGDNFDCLHLSSRCFDEPRVLELISECNTVIAVHGYAAPGPDVLLGGLNGPLKQELAQSLAAGGVSVVSEGHRFPGEDTRNVCNRGRSGKGVQLELSEGFRRARDWAGFAGAIRGVLYKHASRFE